MTHLQQFQDLFDSVNIAYQRSELEEGGIRLGVGDPNADYELRVDGPVRCYPGFYAEYIFDQAGRFVYMGVYE